MNVTLTMKCLPLWYVSNLLKSDGDRIYLDGTLKICLSLLHTVKNMNCTYPKTSSDFDEEFLFHLIKAFFSKDEVLACHSTGKLTPLKRDKLKMLKGNTIRNTRSIGLLSWHLFRLSALFLERIVQTDKNVMREQTVRKKMMSGITRLAEKLYSE